MFHVILVASTDRWNDLVPLVNADPNGYFVSQNRPMTVDPSNWCFKIGAANYLEEVGNNRPGFENVTQAGIRLAEDISSIIRTGASQHVYAGLPGVIPAKVFVDEFRTSQNPHLPPDVGKVVHYTEFFRACGYTLRTYAMPTVDARWAVALQHCQNDAGYEKHRNTAGDAHAEILTGGGYLVFQQYPYRQYWCAAQQANGKGDKRIWDFFRSTPNGAGGFEGMEVVWDRFPSYRHRMRVLLGVGDEFLGTSANAGAQRFLDRMIYILKTGGVGGGTPKFSSLVTTWGGPGSYIWEASKVSEFARDLHFKTSWGYYATGGGTTARFSVVCS